MDEYHHWAHGVFLQDIFMCQINYSKREKFAVRRFNAKRHFMFVNDCFKMLAPFVYLFMTATRN